MLRRSIRKYRLGFCCTVFKCVDSRFVLLGSNPFSMDLDLGQTT
jgi:hypothetical protein